MGKQYIKKLDKIYNVLENDTSYGEKAEKEGKEFGSLQP